MIGWIILHVLGFLFGTLSGFVVGWYWCGYEERARDREDARNAARDSSQRS